MKKTIDGILAGIKHPETGAPLGDMATSIACSDDRIAIVLATKRQRDPFAKSLVKQLTASLTAAFPHLEGKITVEVKPATTEAQEGKKPDGTAGVRKVIGIASGKGGVGKSTVAANLAVTLAGMGYKVGLLDADIYGPSQPHMFGVEDYVPAADMSGGVEMIVPVEAHGIKLMSVGFFITPTDALIWRGPMATGALKQLIHQTLWGDVDYLLIDMPPGTGDVHLTLMSELRFDGAVIVSTPQQVALADVRRGISMFRSDKINIPVLGIIENMAWFTPAELPDNRYYIFGRGGAKELASAEGLDLLGEIPVIQNVMQGAEDGKPGSLTDPLTAPYYRTVAEKIVDKLPLGC